MTSSSSSKVSFLCDTIVVSDTLLQSSAVNLPTLPMAILKCLDLSIGISTPTNRHTNQ